MKLLARQLNMESCQWAMHEQTPAWLRVYDAPRYNYAPDMKPLVMHSFHAMTKDLDLAWTMLRVV
jgi:hypothetical protein